MTEQKQFPIQPLYDQVFIKKDDDEMTETGLHLPQTVKGRMPTGIVVATGPGHLNVETGEYVALPVQPGDRVYVKEFSGYMIRFRGHEVHVFKGMEIVGKVIDE